MVTYLDETRITAWKTTDQPHYGVTVFGYSCNRGAPSDRMIKIDGKGPWRRVMVWCFSNASTTFVKIDGKPFVMPGHIEWR